MLIFGLYFGLLFRARGHANVAWAYAGHASILIWTIYELFMFFTDVYLDFLVRRGLKIGIFSLKYSEIAVYDCTFEHITSVWSMITVNRCMHMLLFIILINGVLVCV